MSELRIWENEGRMTELVEEQKRLFSESDLIKPLRSRELLLGSTALSFVASPSLYRGIPAEVIDNPKTDTLSVLVDEPTVEDLVDEYSRPEVLSEEDVLRLYVGTGFANLLIRHSLGPIRPSRIQKFAEELSQPQGFYACTMASEIFDDKQADETARTIASDNHEQTARVNALRLRTGMFIEVQLDPADMRRNVGKAFQEGLKGVFTGKETYLETVGLFGKAEHEAKDLHANTVETLMGLSFPMNKKEVKHMIGIIKTN